jgi:SAM-dependent methyltransferase
MVGVDADQARASYDAVAGAYAAEFFDELSRKPFDRDLLDRFAAGCEHGRVLDIGCGPGHVARYLRARGADASGLDLSPAMVELARELNPGLAFAVGDMRSLDEYRGLRGIAAFYSLIHIRRPEVASVLEGFRDALSSDGRLLIAVHGGRGDIHRSEFLGRPVPFEATLFSLGEIVTLVESAGFWVDEAHQREPYQFEHPTPRVYVSAHRSDSHPGPPAPPSGTMSGRG